ncbi:MAG: class I SAM-dependent methyltransferase [bacterium]
MADTSREQLEEVARTMSHAAGLDEVLNHLTYKALGEHFTGETCLDVGCGEGLHIPFLLDRFGHVTIVDGSLMLVEKARKNYPSERLEIVHSMIGDYRPEGKFDTIILGHVLQYLDDGVPVIRAVREWLSLQGRLLICDSNADSIHRSAAVIMGLLSSVTELGPRKQSLAQRRVYTRALLEKEVQQAGGWTIEHFGGYFLKPLTNAQLESIGTPDLINAYYELGRRYPDIAAEIYVVCRLAEQQ